MEEQKKKKSFSAFHDKYYKHLLLIPLLLLVLSFGILAMNYVQSGEVIKRDISLTGGTSITIFDVTLTSEQQDTLRNQLENIFFQELTDRFSGEVQGIVIETTADVDTARPIIEEVVGVELTQENSSIEFTGASLSESFYRQLLFAVLTALVFMAIVVFLLFRTTVPSLAVILAAIADLIMALAVASFLDMHLSAAGIVAFLMLIGYSVDTDILLTTRVVKRREGSLNERIQSAFKTGTTMTLTSMIAMGVALLMVGSSSLILSQMFAILLIGLVFDLLNTWITNVSLLKWYVLKTEGTKE